MIVRSDPYTAHNGDPRIPGVTCGFFSTLQKLLSVGPVLTFVSRAGFANRYDFPVDMEFTHQSRAFEFRSEHRSGEPETDKTYQRFSGSG